MGSPTFLNEALTDVKAPGDGFTYAVGTIDVRDTRLTSSPTFSGVAVGLPPLPPPASVGFFIPTANRQVVILQKTDIVAGIVSQVYFYGFTPGLAEEGDGHATNARGISVWAADTEADTRFVICGETWDKELPLSQFPIGTGRANASPAHPSGFIAVYDGSLTLLWSHMFFGVEDYDCAITDVSIRVEDAGTPLARDVVTFCGISSFGNPAAGNAELTTILSFAAPRAPSGCDNPAAGTTDNGVAQWDGIVGRVSRDHAGTLASLRREFLSVVGGKDQDGLFGIAEMDSQRFVTDGTTARTATSASGPGTNHFPITIPFPCLGGVDRFYLGAALIFDATPTRLAIPGALVLEASTTIGNVGADYHTACRDVAVQLDAVPSTPARHVIYIVGSTDDDDPTVPRSMFSPSSLAIPVAPSPQANRSGPTDGFILTAEDVPGSVVVLTKQGSFRGGEGYDGLTGVGGWNEHLDQVTAFGFTRPLLGTNDFDVVSIFSDTPNAPGTVAQLTFTRTGTVGGTSIETPAAMGAIIATNAATGLGYDQANLDSPAGGGVCVDDQARVNIVGATVSIDHPVTAAPFLPGRAFLGGQDGVRSMLDMLPARVGRCDGTGTLAAPLAPAPAPIPGTTGATTPTCNLTPFGHRVSSATPALMRMNIDYEGPAPANGVAPVLLVDRPPANSTVIAAVVQISVPGAGPIDPLPVSFVELWPQPGALVLLFGPPAAPSSFRLNTLFALPPPPASFTMQVIMLLGANLPACGAGRNVFNMAGSPALIFDY